MDLFIVYFDADDCCASWFNLSADITGKRYHLIKRKKPHQLNDAAFT